MLDFQARSATRSQLVALLLLSAALGGCPQTPPPQATAPPPAPQELTFDRQYYDSISLPPPRSARTERQLAIFMQLQRLRMTQPYRTQQGQVVPTGEQSSDSVYEQLGVGQPRRGFANKAQELADIHRKLDSLKVLEHIPLTRY